MDCDVIVIGAGPTGLACAIELERKGIDYCVLDKGCLVNSLARFPTNMVYFTTPELLEIGEIPLVCMFEKPTRVEALKYYRGVVDACKLRICQYEKVARVSGADGSFQIATGRRSGEQREHRARKVILATGYFDYPNLLGIPGEVLPKCSHYYTEPYEYYAQDVVVIGAANSAAEAALELYRAGARVTIVHRGADLNPSLKYWVEPDIRNRLKAGVIAARFQTEVRAIRPDHVVLRDLQSDRLEELANDQVFALTGYHADNAFMRSMGIEIDPATMVPTHNVETFESNVPGLYLAGVILAGRKANQIFIENGRFHGKVVVGAIASSLSAREVRR